MSSSSKNSKKVISLYLSKESSQRISVEVISVDEKGVLDDKFYAKDMQRSILITSIDSYLMAEESGIDVPHSSLGENILVDCNPYALPLGSRLLIGDAVLEITQNCTLCKSLTKVDSRLPKLLKNDRGIFAKVIRRGIIKVGDKIEVDSAL